MNISKFKIVIKYIFGGTSAVVEYILGVVNKALSSVDTSSKEKAQALLNTLLKANATLKAIAWLVPTKWQTAYGKTLDSIFSIVMMLEDLQITKEEIDIAYDRSKAAIAAWKSPDDETCVDGNDL